MQQLDEPQRVVVVDDSMRHRNPTGLVTVTAPADATDRELADAAGFCSRHWGYTIDRYSDGTALVSLWND